MATGTVYLDVDDEITSAAARIRGSEATKVALVIPYGSRISTSRMNFRLLSREAVVNNRRLSIVATDPATRALAASAGLPVFASVAEWDADASKGDAGAAGAAIVAATVIAQPPPSPTGSRSRKKTPVPDEAPTLGLPAAAVAAAGTASAASAASAAGSGSAGGASPEAAAPPAKLPSGTPPVRTTPVGDRTSVGTRSMPRIGGAAIVIAAAVVLAIVVAGVGAYVFLPSAEIVVTPREEPVSIALVIRADPDVTAPDATANLVPADRVEIPVTASDTFPATDKRVEDTLAKGDVTFTSENTFIEVTVPRGTRVATDSGIAFVTTAQVVIPKASFSTGPSRKDAPIEAIRPGQSGNVEAGTITQRPSDLRLLLVSVTNREATTGGTHQEFPRVSQEDVDAAMTSLQSQLASEFSTALEDGAGAPPSATVFVDTAVLGEATPTPDPATLVGKEQESFDLALSATGTVIAVDESPVVKIAETRLLANIGADHRLVEGSIEIVPGDPTVTNGEVSFPVTATAARVQILDPAELLALVQGQSIADARTILGEYGVAEITPWPDWVSAIPGIDSRVTIVIVGQTDQAGDGSPGPSGTSRPPGAATPTATARPSGASGSPGTSSQSSSASPPASAAP